jgi:hypothetical protein
MQTTETKKVPSFNFEVRETLLSQGRLTRIRTMTIGINNPANQAGKTSKRVWMGQKIQGATVCSRGGASGLRSIGAGLRRARVRQNRMKPNEAIFSRLIRD